MDVITLDNFVAKTAGVSHDGTSHVYAMVDMGSNGIRFSVSDLSPPHARLLPCLYQERAGISLFDALQDSEKGTKSLAATTIQLVARTVARFGRIAVDDYDVPREHVMVFATEAVRRASNADDLVLAIRALCGFSLQVLAPEVETLFGAVGARSGFVHAQGLFLDLGGGSVQMTYLDAAVQDYEMAAARAGQSLPFGAARLTRILDGGEAHVVAAETGTLHAGMRAALERLCVVFPSLAKTVADHAGLDVYLYGGGFRGYGSMLMHTDPNQPYPIAAVGTYSTDASRFRQTAELMAVNRNHEGRIFGMSSRRRAQFPAVVAVVDALVAAVPTRLRRATFCAGGTREGALSLMLPRAVRDANPLALLSTGGDVSGAVLAVLRTALPDSAVLDIENMTAPALRLVSAHDVGGLFAPAVWHHMGASEEDNAAAALHYACTSRPGCPGLTHAVRAVLGVALCARWGGDLGPVDEPLRLGLREIVAADIGPDAVFWVEYVGVAAAVIAKVVAAWPSTVDKLHRSVGFRAHAEQGVKKLNIKLDVYVDAESAAAIDADDFSSMFKKVAKHHETKKVTVTVHPWAKAGHA